MPERYFPKDIACPICKAQHQKSCELLNGTPRFESHIERKWIAADLNHGRLLTEIVPISEVPQNGQGRSTTQASAARTHRQNP